MDALIRISIITITLTTTFFSSSRADALHDVQSLVAFKTFITNDPLKSLADWHAEAPNACNFTGISCSLRHPGRVVGIQLGNRGLQGSIAPEIGNLSFLQTLNLSANEFKGDIPFTIGRLRRLKYFDASKNGYSDIIPPSLSNCSSLLYLDLSDNHLRGRIPKNIGSLANLYHLDMGNNSLIGTIPDSMRNLSALVSVDITANSLQGRIPAWFGMLSKLEELSLWGNSFIGEIPESIGNATSLKILYLGSNNLVGIIPSSLGRLSQLNTLYLANNHHVSGVSNPQMPIPILEALSNCTKLQFLALYNNKLSGTLPPSIGMLSQKLEFLSLGNNSISGHIPSSIGNLSSLISCFIQYNLLDGIIPSSISRMKSIQKIQLSHNMLEGQIPSQFSLMNQTLNFLYLDRNRLSGSIPSSLGELVNLRELNLSMNSLSGAIPSEIGKCTLLQTLDLSSNNLIGPIPQEVANLAQIQEIFNLSRNSLSGMVPRAMRALQMAQGIDLSDNNLYGEIAPEMTQWINAQKVNLSFNNFSGVLQESIGYKLSSLQIMDVSNNKFTGNVPQSLSQLPNLHILDLSSNHFNGSVVCSDGFANLSLSRSFSFLNNSLLCGNCSGLTKCIHHKESSKKLKIIVGVFVPLSVLLILCLAIIIFLVSRKKAPISESENENAPPFMCISRRDIVMATQDFSASNLLGQGNHGSVYKGHLANGETVAIKVFSSSRSDRSFIRECETLGKIRHRNLVKILTVCSTDTFKALVLQFIPNGNLYNLVHGRDADGCLIPIDLHTKVKMLKELANGLAYLNHYCTPPIVHCDVKPQNVLLDSDFTIKIADFGIAHLLGDLEDDNAASSTSTHKLKGTIGYMAPEYGLGSGISLKGDVYSFGVVVLETMTRISPTDNMFSENLSLPTWVSTNLQGDRKQRLEMVKTALICKEEECLNVERSEVKLGVLETVMRVGSLCTCQDPEKRPTMLHVESFLNQLYDDLHNKRLAQLKKLLHSMEGKFSIQRKGGENTNIVALRTSTFLHL